MPAIRDACSSKDSTQCKHSKAIFLSFPAKIFAVGKSLFKQFSAQRIWPFETVWHHGHFWKPAIRKYSCNNQHHSIARNKITDSILKSWENLTELESLDSFSNNLFGLIPTELENLIDLQMLNLSFNSLKGEVPKNGVFANISWDSLQGNNQRL